MANVTFSTDINPNDNAFYYLNESTEALSKSKSNITILKKILEDLDEIEVTSESLEMKVEKYNNDFKENIDLIYTSTEIIEKFVHKINTIDLMELAKDLTVDKEKEETDTINGRDLEISYIENTLVISEEQKKVILPYTINKVKEILLNNTKEYFSLQDVIDKVYTKPISYYKFSAIARFREAYKLIKEKEKGSKAKALELAFEMLLNYNLHPAIITACENLNQLDVYLACLEDNTLEEFEFFDIKYEIPLAISKHIKNEII